MDDVKWAWRVKCDVVGRTKGNGIAKRSDRIQIDYLSARQFVSNERVWKDNLNKMEVWHAMNHWHTTGHSSQHLATASASMLVDKD